MDELDEMPHSSLTAREFKIYATGESYIGYIESPWMADLLSFAESGEYMTLVENQQYD